MDTDRADSPLDSQIMEAWKQAAQDLGIRVEIPFTLRTETGSVQVCEGRVLDFGGPKGVLFRPIGSDENRDKSLKETGFFLSQLGSSYYQYDRQLFIDTLDDWKWFGPKGGQPEWYTGKNWS